MGNEPEDLVVVVGCPEVLSSPSDVMKALAQGWTVLCEWQANGVGREPGRVLAVRGNAVLVSHWSDVWLVIGDPAIRIVGYPPILPGDSFQEWLEEKKLQLPDSSKSGNSWGAASAVATMYGRYLREKATA